MAELPNTSFNPDVIAEFRANGGKVGGPWQDAALLLLHYRRQIRATACRSAWLVRCRRQDRGRWFLCRCRHQSCVGT